jgi:hypothetical protein
MVEFVEAYGRGPIFRIIGMAPSTFYEHQARKRTRSVRRRAAGATPCCARKSRDAGD